jgi:2-polyprenyl-3-methyl-5-hydroxy-6-metoxy-1,4-benzoquinol methylase
MDKETIAVYDREPERFAREWVEQPSPQDLYDLLLRYFRPGPTVDIGCGSGRDAAWLAKNGFEVEGFDASLNFLNEARSRYPDLKFEQSVLPELQGVPRRSYENVLCETVIMHLEQDQVGPSTETLAELLRPGGTLYLSWRITPDRSERDKLGRLYTAFDKQVVLSALTDFDLLLDESSPSLSSGKLIHRLIARKVQP